MVNYHIWSPRIPDSPRIESPNFVPQILNESAIFQNSVENQILPNIEFRISNDLTRINGKDQNFRYIFASL